MRGKYERSPGFRLLKTDSFAIMFYGFYHGIKEVQDITLMKAANIFCEKYANCDLEPTDMLNGYSRLCAIIKEMKPNK